jgi:prepilin-type processing-associated H-X9-DG protein
MEILVVIAIIVVLAAIAFPVYGRIKANSNKATALNIMRQLAGAIAPYAGENDGELPAEDVEGKDSWKEASEPNADRAWYNALVHQLGQKSLGDFVKEKREAAFYTKENFLYLAGADYPESKKKEKPLFAIAINTKLQRKQKSADGKDDKKPAVKLSAIMVPSRTVAFLEQGLPGEPKAHDTISAKDDYDGSPKGSAKSFVARYTGKGTISFVDGHAEEVSGKDLLNNQGDILWEEDWMTTNPSGIFWTADPKEDPNQKAP